MVAATLAVGTESTLAIDEASTSAGALVAVATAAATLLSERSPPHRDPEEVVVTVGVDDVPELLEAETAPPAASVADEMLVVVADPAASLEAPRLADVEERPCLAAVEADLPPLTPPVASVAA